MQALDHQLSMGLEYYFGACACEGRDLCINIVRCWKSDWILPLETQLEYNLHTYYLYTYVNINRIRIPKLIRILYSRLYEFTGQVGINLYVCKHEFKIDSMTVMSYTSLHYLPFQMTIVTSSFFNPAWMILHNDSS